MKIIVFTDTHANLPALLAFRKAIEAEGYDLAFHTGDAIDIGPYPAESLEVLMEIPRLECVLGNHDAVFVHGIPDPLPTSMAENEAEHCRWTAGQLTDEHRQAMARWPLYLKQELDDTSVVFVHYGLTADMTSFIPTLLDDPTPLELDFVFRHFKTDLLFYGHSHPFSDVQGKARYINPGALGCFYRPLARYCVLEFRPGGYRLTYHAVPYNDEELQREYERRKVPARKFILREFFGKNI